MEEKEDVKHGKTPSYSGIILKGGLRPKCTISC